MRERWSSGKALRGSVLGVAMILGLGAGAVDVASAQGAEPRFVLSGIVIDAWGAARVLIEEPQLTGSRSVLLRVGDTLGAYRVASIGTDHTVLQGPGGALRIPLSGIAGSGTAVANRAPGSTPAATGASGPSGIPFPRQGDGVPLPTPQELEKMLTPPPPGVYRHASEGVSAPVTGPPRWDVEDFKRQVQRHLIGLPH